MKRHHLIVLALAGGLITAAAPFAAEAQSGDALANAEQLCLDTGISPNSAAFNACVGRAAMAYDRGDPYMAERDAQMAIDARNTCLRYGIDPHTLGYRQCVNNEIDRGADSVMVYRGSARAIVLPKAHVIYN